MEFKVEKAVPIPTQFRPKKESERYPFSQMGIDDSFAVSDGAVTADKLMGRLRGALNTFKKKYPDMKFTIRKLDNTTVRIWRIK